MKKCKWNIIISFSLRSHFISTWLLRRPIIFIRSCAFDHLGRKVRSVFYMLFEIFKSQCEKPCMDSDLYIYSTFRFDWSVWDFPLKIRLNFWDHPFKKINLRRVDHKLLVCHNRKRHILSFIGFSTLWISCKFRKTKM